MSYVQPKQIWTFLLIAVMMVSGLPISGHFASAQAGSDIAGHWAEPTLKEWISSGDISGYEDGSFRPDANITRAEWMHIVNGLFGFRTGRDVHFSDVPENAWFKQDIELALEAGYLSGYSDGTIKPNQPISRQEAAVMLSHLGQLPAYSSAVKNFKDPIPAWSQGSVGAVIAAGWMNGYPDQTFGPKQYLSRAEAVIILERSQYQITLAQNSTKAYNVPDSNYSAAGNYGPEVGEQTIKGDVKILASGVRLKNSRITGNVTIASSIGDGEVTLQGVTIDGELYVNGGGQNSVFLEDTIVSSMKVNKDDGQIRIVASGSSSIRNATVDSGASLEERQLTGKGFESVTLSKLIPANNTVFLSGRFTTTAVYASGIHATLSSGRIDKLVADQEVNRVIVELEDNTRIGLAVIGSGVTIIGKGIVENYDRPPSSSSVGSGGNNGGGNTGQPAPTVTQLVYEPKNITFQALGSTQSVSLSALFSNSTTNNVTASSVWASDDERVAVVSRGVVTAAGEGSTLIHATYKGLTISIPVTVRIDDIGGQPEPTVIRLEVSPVTIDFNGLNQTATLTLTAVMSDGTQKDVSDEAVWASNDESIASVTQRIVTAMGPGSTIITAGYQGFESTVPVTVTVPPAIIPAYTIQASLANHQAQYAAGSEIPVNFDVYKSDGTIDSGFNGLHNVKISGYSPAPDGSIGSFDNSILNIYSTDVQLNFSNGSATALIRLNSAAAQALKFSVDGIQNGDAGISALIAAADPAKLAIHTQPSSSVEQGQVFSVQPVIHVLDAFDNPSSADLDVTASVHSGNSTLTGTTVVKANQGIVSYTDLALNGADKNVKLLFTAVHLTEAISDPIEVKGPFDSGNGTVSDPYVIKTAEQLNNVRYNLSDYFVLGADIDLSGLNWSPIGASGNGFTGIFDGSGYTIRNLTISSNNQSNLGLFGILGIGAIVKNLNLENANIHSGYSNAGALVAFMDVGSQLTDSSVKGTGLIDGYYYTGGLVGRVALGASVSRSFADISVKGTFGAGGLVGSNEGWIQQSYSLGDVISNGQQAGGLAGINGGTILNSYSLSKIQGGTINIGGLVGDLLSTGTITNSYASGTIISTATNIGGLVGGKSSSTSKINNSFFNQDQNAFANGHGTGLTDSQMKFQGSFQGWDFTGIWAIDPAKNHGYPYLR